MPYNTTVFQFILEHFRWTGKKMVFPYMVDGKDYTATIYMRDLFKIIRWEKTYEPDEPNKKVPLLQKETVVLPSKEAKLYGDICAAIEGDDNNK